MSIFKDTFRRYVRDQLSIREKLIEIGNLNDIGSRTNRRQSNTVTLQSGKKSTLPADSYYQYTTNKQCGIRLTSLVDYVEDIKLDLSTFKNLKGASLSERFILEGGTLGAGRSRSTLRGGFGDLNSAYGDPFIASDASSDGYGIVPMPGIIDIQVRTKTAYGSLREAKVNFECHNRRQLEVLEMLYMRPGYVVLLEWGSTPYIKNDGNIVHNVRLVEDVLRNSNGESDLYTNNITQPRLYNAINNLKESSCGNYDGFLGFVKNFGFQAREDGGYLCYTELITMGEVLESLKAPNISPFSPIFLNSQLETNSTATTDPTSTPLTEDQRVAETLTGITTERYNEAVRLRIIPEYNGLEGLTKSLKTYATFNQFTLGNPTAYTVNQFGTFGSGGSRQIVYKKAGWGSLTDYKAAGYKINPISINYVVDIFPEYNFEADEINTLKTEQGVDDGSETNLLVDLNTRQQLDYFTTDVLVGAPDSAAQSRALQLESLLRYRGSTIQSALVKKLQLSSANLLNNYIIPRGGIEYNRIPEGTLGAGNVIVNDAGEATGVYRNDQPFIRWDALTILINDALIPQNENLKTPVNIIADRIYDEGNGKYRLDPLKYASITELSEGEDERYVYDFSTDPNTCILPVQFSTVYPDFIEKQLGYVPDIYTFPQSYVEALYEKGGNVTYRGNPITPSTKLVEADANNRIGSIFININMIDYIASKNSTNTNYTVGNFITDIWDEINKACPNHNFVLTDDKESNCLYIIDLPVDKDELPPPLELHEFVPFSNKNILRNFSYTSNVPSALTSTIAIQSQDPRNIQDIDGVTFAAFNRAIKNRLFSTDIVSTWEKTKQSVEDRASELSKKFSLLNQELYNYRFNFFKDLSAEANDQDLKGGNIAGILKEYQQLNTYISETKDLGTSFASVIPLEFNATLDGISGIVIGNLFKVQKDRLPRAYANTNIGFIVFNEEQKVTAGGDWTTDISGKMIILDDPSAVKIPIKYIPVYELDPEFTGPLSTDVNPNQRPDLNDENIIVPLFGEIRRTPNT